MDSTRYSKLEYRKCGNNGLKLPILSLGLWHNFGGEAVPEQVDEMLIKAFENGITHFDLANNYGPPYGSAEEQFGRALKGILAGYRDELVISTKAGFDMWEGPYGKGGSRKYLISSLDQSLKRMGLEYVDIFYHHVPDHETPLEESMRALDQVVQSGKALYVGISNYPADLAKEAFQMLKSMGTPVIIHQQKYNMFHREPEYGLFDVIREEGMGCITFSPLAQGLLTNKYLDGIPKESRIADPKGFLQGDSLNDHVVNKIQRLNEVALQRGQSLAQLALIWDLRKPEVTSTIIGIRNIEQLNDNLKALENMLLSEDEESHINLILNS